MKHVKQKDCESQLISYLSPVIKSAIIRELRDGLGMDCISEFLQILINVVKLHWGISIGQQHWERREPYMFPQKTSRLDVLQIHLQQILLTRSERLHVGLERRKTRHFYAPCMFRYALEPDLNMPPRTTLREPRTGPVISIPYLFLIAWSGRWLRSSLRISVRLVRDAST